MGRELECKSATRPSRTTGDATKFCKAVQISSSVKNEATVGSLPSNGTSEFVQSFFLPAVTWQTYYLEYCPFTIRSTLESHSVEVTQPITNETSNRESSINPSGKVVQQMFSPLARRSRH